jgi:hypothetical protein
VRSIAVVRRFPLLAAPPALFLIASLATYREWVDGPPGVFLLGIVCAAGAGALVLAWGMTRGAAAALVLVAALAAVLPAPAMHLVRLRDRHTPLQKEVTAWWDPDSVVRSTVNGSAAVRAAPDEVTLRVPAGSTGYFELQPDLTRSGPWSLPRGLFAASDRDVGEEVAWRASVEIDQAYFGLFEVNRVIAQLTSWGVLVTAPGPGGEPTGEGVTLPLENGAWQDWALRRTPGSLSLLAGERVVWSTTADPGSLRAIKIGETRTDGEHGGTLRLRTLRVARFRV